MRVGLPRDPAQFVALFVGLLALVGASRLVRDRRRDGVFLGTCAFVATALSAAYVAMYLRGGPRIIDATSYFLEARALAEGHLAFRLDDPIASTLGRFLVRVDGAEGPHAAVIFPPGYPAVLALGFLIGQPMIIGPLLAAALTVSTWALAKAVAPTETSSFSSPRLAVLFSVACAALRYHTADTMSHGVSALCFTSALVFAHRAMQANRGAFASSALAGLFTGWLAATRPVSALALGVVLAVLFVPAIRSRPRVTFFALTAVVLGCLPGLVLLVAHQAAATGEFFASSQNAYYAVSDGPPGCFRYGFGAGIGCVGEHGEFVQKNLVHGYGAFAAAATTLRRLKQHLVDAGNAEPFFFVVLAGAALAFRDARMRVLPLAILVQIAAYVPFYFDGNYPGGGARFYADVLPLEHVLAALAVVRFAERARDARRAAWRVSALVALVPLGFAFRGGFEHAALRDREGGRPMFEASRLPPVQGPALLFVDTDHGFNLAFDPDRHGSSPRDALSSKDWRVLRYRGDALDLLAWERHGKLPAYRYVFPLGADHPDVRVVPYAIDPARPLVIEAENLWPPLAQDQGYALTTWPNAPCASAGRWLVVKPVHPEKPAAITVSLPAPLVAGGRVTAQLGLAGRTSAKLLYWIDGSLARSFEVHSSSRAVSDSIHDPSIQCLRTPALAVPPEARLISVTIQRDPGPGETEVALDRFELERPEND